MRRRPLLGYDSRSSFQLPPEQLGTDDVYRFIFTSIRYKLQVISTYRLYQFKSPTPTPTPTSSNFNSPASTFFLLIDIPLLILLNINFYFESFNLSFLPQSTSLHLISSHLISLLIISSSSRTLQ
ncbi:hypothetical protein EYC84_007935 [Monilinia fructicola]|uniref:Uncharacterized protein n=1 Tax=Monilinia fructicola TaxID=38448 RepID=A0A5M9JI40_MONFR|nr:hypothetical protein EYC84_007935 [Monilinia fructicola]